ncbi:MAG TPA: hypothetical protein PLN24_07355 [Victivallales bacterium]|nr:hypothetical protein [Victivallales bacterium]
MPLIEFEKEFPLIVGALKNAIRNGKIAHAYLLHCDDQNLTESFITAMVQALLCKNKTSDYDACGYCDICSKIATGTYPELYYLMPTSKSRKIPIGEDENQEDSLRWFQSLFYYKAVFFAEKKIGIIYDADTMMQQAQNAFLKTLEEPPVDSIFIICTGNPQELLPTVRSRCQRITILRNSQTYSGEIYQKTLQIFEKLSCVNNLKLQDVESSAIDLIAIFSQLKEDAEREVLEKWKTKLEDNSIDEKLQKKILERLEASKSSEYLLFRQRLLSLIHSYFVELYQLSIGIELKTLPNPEIIMNYDNKNKLDKDKALTYLHNTEDFIKTMSLNVSEELAIRTFSYSFLSN